MLEPVKSEPSVSALRSMNCVEPDAALGAADIVDKSDRAPAPRSPCGGRPRRSADRAPATRPLAPTLIFTALASRRAKPVMPELPEVEASRRLLETNLGGLKVTAVGALEAGGHARAGEFDSIVMDDADASADNFIKSLKGKTLVAVHRKGKQMWLEMSKPPHLLAHFGMTGSFVIQGIDAPTYQEFKIHDEEWPPRFTKLELTFGSTKLAFCDPRRLGRLRLRTNPIEQEPWCALAPDALLDPLKADRATEVLSTTSTAIKALLLDQNKLVSGVGNWVADEVLFQACIHPESRCNTLSAKQVIKLCEVMQEVLSVAVGVNAEAGSFPESWLFHYRWGKGGRKGADAHPRVPGAKGGPITFITVGGRTSAVVLNRQKKGEGSDGGGDAEPKTAKKTKAAPKKKAAETESKYFEVEAKPKAAKRAKRS